MKHLALILIAFLIGDCVQITRGILKSNKQCWKIVDWDKTGYVLYDGDWTVHSVPENAMRQVDDKRCDGIGEKK